MKAKALLVSFGIILTVTSCGFKLKKGAASVKIGTQEWSTQNLNVSTFRNGDKIPEAEDTGAWAKASDEGKPAWCYYNADSNYGKKYGKLYNWYAVNDPRGLAPKGWHLPSDKEWDILFEYCGGSQFAGSKLKCDTGWDCDGSGDMTTRYADNSSGFTGLPAPMRGTDGKFLNLESEECFWSLADDGWVYALNCGLEVEHDGSIKGCGFSCRCVKD
jgi:uncharacterized protein (TIGR02145 family)